MSYEPSMQHRTVTADRRQQQSQIGLTKRAAEKISVGEIRRTKLSSIFHKITMRLLLRSYMRLFPQVKLTQDIGNIKIIPVIRTYETTLSKKKMSHK